MNITRMAPKWTIVAAIVIIIILIFTFLISRREHLWVEQSAELEMYDFQASAPGPTLCLIAGTHGNEPAGSIALRQLAQEFSSGRRQLAKGRLRIVPVVNAWGIAHGIRYTDALGIMPKSDVNRNYTENGGTEPISKEVVKLAMGADLVIDFHEGWGYHTCQPNSIGSTLTPTDHNPAPQIAVQAVAAINQPFLDMSRNAPSTNRCRRFMALAGESCRISSTLACYMQKNKRPYILVETTGQYNVQPMKVRTNQVNTVIDTALAGLNMV